MRWQWCSKSLVQSKNKVKVQRVTQCSKEERSEPPYTLLEPWGISWVSEDREHSSQDNRKTFMSCVIISSTGRDTIYTCRDSLYIEKYTIRQIP